MTTTTTTSTYNEHFYTFEQRLDEVYQWRNHVFSRSRHFDKAQVLSKGDLVKLSGTQAQGGFVLPLRAVPMYVGEMRAETVKALRSYSSTSITR